MSNLDSASGLNRVLFCEGNIDGTIGGSYFSLMFLVAGLDRSKFEPVVVFRTSNSLIPRYNDLGIRTLVVPIPRPTKFRVLQDTSNLLYRIAYPG